MKFKVVNRCKEDLSSMHGMLKSFLPFSKKRLGFDKPPTIFLQSDEANAQKLLGKTAYYDPSTMGITVYVTGRHPKDVLRSLSHELVHHGQNCRGEFGHTPDTAPGYAQNDQHLRSMEEEAYKEGNLCFRDWEDGVKSGKISVPIQIKESVIKEIEENPILSRGMGMQGTPNKDVAALQAVLVQIMGDAILPKHGVDGRYGPETERAVKQFQSKHGLEDTGSVDKNTLQKLQSLGDFTKASATASEMGNQNKRFAADPTYTGGLKEVMQKVNPSRLYRDLINSGLNESISKALVANAMGESAFIIGIAGDQGTYARVRFKNRSIPFDGKGPSCSLGLWQFNICGGLGLEYMQYLNLTHKDDDQKIYSEITKYQNQINFMSSYLLSKRNLPRQASPEEYVAWLVINVIRPAKQREAIETRLGHLRKLESRGTFSISLEEWKNNEINRLLLEKFNFGDKK